MPPDFFNSREDAILVCGVLILGYAVYKSPKDMTSGVLGVVRALLHPKLLLLNGSALLYSALAVWTASALELWHGPALKATIYWFVGFAFVLIGDAVSRPSDTEQDLVWRALKRVVAVTVIVEFVVNLYALPLPFELIGVFIVALFGGMHVVAQHDPASDARVLRFIASVLATVGLLYIGYSLIRAFSDLDGLLTRERAEDLIVPVGLTVVLLPFLFAVAWLSRLDQERLLRRWRSTSDAPV